MYYVKCMYDDIIIVQFDVGMHRMLIVKCMYSAIHTVRCTVRCTVQCIVRCTVRCTMLCTMLCTMCIVNSELQYRGE